MTLSEATTLEGRYKISGVMGEPGSFDVTYTAEDKKANKKRVLVREYLPQRLAERGDDGVVTVREASHEEVFAFGRKYFLKEASLLRQLEHKSLVPERDAFEANGTAYRVSDLQRGKILAEALAAGETFEPEAAREKVVSVLDALEEIHAAGLFHGGISPESLLLTDAGDLALFKFRVAHIVLAHEYDGVDELIIPGYTPPEQYDADGKFGAWSDVYGVSAVLTAMLTGVAPPAAPVRSQNDRLTQLLARVPNVTDDFREVLTWGLALDPQERPQTVGAFRTMLADVAVVDPKAIVEPPVVEPAPAADSTAVVAVAEEGRVDGIVETPQEEGLVPRHQGSEEVLAREDRAPAPASSRKAIGIAAGLALFVSVAGGAYFMTGGGDAEHARFVATADSLYEARDYQAALVQYEAALEVNPDDRYTANRLSDARRLAEDQTAVEEQLRQHALFVARGDSLLSMAATLAEDGDRAFASRVYSEAREAFLQAMIHNPNDAATQERIRGLKANPYADNGSGARQSEADLAAERERAYEFYVQQGEQLLKQRQFMEARAKFRMALEYKPRDEYVEAKLAEVDSGFTEAERTSRVQAYLSQARKLAGEGRLQEARRAYTLAIEVAPTNEAALSGLTALDERIAAEQQGEQEAEQQYQYLRGQGDVLLAKGDFEQAIASYQQALTHRPDDEYVTAKIQETKSAAAIQELGEQWRQQDGIYTVPDVPAQLEGGLEALHRRAVYPTLASARRTEGRVYVQFIVDEQGRVQNAEVVRGIGDGCDEEALRVIRQARFEPGKVDGKPVKTRETLFIDFRLDKYGRGS